MANQSCGIYVDGPAVLGLLREIKQLWDREGFGSNPNISDPLYARLNRAIEELEPRRQFTIDGNPIDGIDLWIAENYAALAPTVIHQIQRMQPGESMNIGAVPTFVLRRVS